MYSAEYIAYMKSDAWRELCQRIYAERGRRCERCGAMGIPLQMHHLNYDRLGHELDSDLQIVCADPCHAEADKEREQREADRKFQKRAEAWAVKVYGENWRDSISPDDAIDEFYAWLQGKAHERWMTM